MPFFQADTLESYDEAGARRTVRFEAVYPRGPAGALG